MGLDNPIHIAFLLVLMLLIFGARRLPEMGRSLGSGLRGFKDALGGEGAHGGEGAQPLLATQRHAPAAAAVSAAASASVPGASASAAEGPDVAPAPPGPERSP